MRALEILATGCLGLLSGAMLLIGGAIVPYWQSLDPDAFAAWFAQNSGYLGGVMVPLGGVTTLLALGTAATGWRRHSPARLHFLLAASCALAVALIYFVEHASLNAQISSGTLAVEEIVTARESWRAWHWARTVAGALGFLAALAGLAGSGREA